MLDSQDDLRIENTALYLDSRTPRPLCFVSHAHSDHIAPHGHIISTPATAALNDHRIGLVQTTRLDYGTPYVLDPAHRLSLHSAGHVLGSAMIRVQRDDGQSLLYTGDFKLRSGFTVDACCVPEQADVLVMESTYGLPFFRFPSRDSVADQLLSLVEEGFRAGRQPIVMGYSLGKAQEITRILTAGGHAVTLHGAPFNLSRIYEQLGVDLGVYRRYAFADFHGPAALDLRQRGVLVAPPNVARSGFVTRFENPLRIVMTGWGLMKNAIYRYGVDYVLPLSDHADFEELLELVERVNPRRIYTLHGYREFADTLKSRGLDARLALKEAQLSLFDD